MQLRPSESWVTSVTSQLPTLRRWNQMRERRKAELGQERRVAVAGGDCAHQRDKDKIGDCLSQLRSQKTGKREGGLRQWPAVLL